MNNYKITNKKNIREILIVALIAFMFMISMDVYAAEYTGNIHGNYRNPANGSIEDSGGEANEALGSSMVSRILSDKAYYEDANGNSYITFSMNLMNSIGELNFQAYNGSGFSSTSYERIFDGDDTSDIRVMVPSKDFILKAECFVEPMGRSVVFFINADGYTPGNESTYPSQVDHSNDEICEVPETKEVCETESVENIESYEEISETEENMKCREIDEASSYSGNEGETLATNVDNNPSFKGSAKEVMDKADGLEFGTSKKDLNNANNNESKKNEEDSEFNDLTLGDGFWMTVFMLFLAANLVAGLILILVFFTVKYIYDKKRDDRKRLEAVFSRDIPDDDDDFIDDFDEEFDEEFDEDFDNENSEE